MATKTRGRRRSSSEAKELVAQGSTSTLPLDIVTPTESDTTPSEEEAFDYEMVEDATVRQLLMNYEGEIRSIIRQSLENVVRLGEIFTIIKEEILPYRQWKAWVHGRFNNEIHISTTHNWMNVYQLYKEYGEKYENALEQIKLRDLYVLGRSGVEAEAKEAALSLVQQQKVNPRDTRKVVETYRKIKLVSAGVQPDVVKMLTKSEIAENPKYVQDLGKLSKTKQQEVAEVLLAGEAQTPREALRVIKESRVPASAPAATAPPVETNNNQTNASNNRPALIDLDVEVNIVNKVERYESLKAVPPGTIQIALVEAPLKFDFINNGEFYDLTKDLGEVLMPGGFALITVGHKAAMFVGAAAHDSLKPIHLVCLRRQPGNTCTIIGLNIASASVYMVLAYKPPYRAPKGFLVADLHTLNDTEALPGMDVVETGLEKSIKHLLQPLLSSAAADENEYAAVLHHVVRGSQHFSLNDYLQEISFELGAREFVSVT